MPQDSASRIAAVRLLSTRHSTSSAQPTPASMDPTSPANAKNRIRSTASRGPLQQFGGRRLQERRQRKSGSAAGGAAPFLAGIGRNFCRLRTSAVLKPGLPIRSGNPPRRGSPSLGRAGDGQKLLERHGDTSDFRGLLRQIPPGTVLFQVLATKKPCDDPEEIGRIVLTSPLVASRRGDFQLFFRHPDGVHFDEKSGKIEDTNVTPHAFTCPGK